MATANPIAWPYVDIDNGSSHGWSVHCENCRYDGALDEHIMHAPSCPECGLDVTPPGGDR